MFKTHHMQITVKAEKGMTPKQVRDEVRSRLNNPEAAPSGTDKLKASKVAVVKQTGHWEDPKMTEVR